MRLALAQSVSFSVFVALLGSASAGTINLTGGSFDPSSLIPSGIPTGGPCISKVIGDSRSTDPSEETKGPKYRDAISVRPLCLPVRLPTERRLRVPFLSRYIDDSGLTGASLP